MRVDRADQTGIEAAGHVTDFHRIGHVSNGRADNGLFHGAVDRLAIPRTDVPGSRGYDLIVLDLAVLDDDPVRQRTAPPQ